MFELTPFARRNRYVASYNPFKELDELEKMMRRSSSDTFEFKTDIRDNGNAYLLEADLPGFKKEDIGIDLDENYLTSNAQRHSESEDKDNAGSYVRLERVYGSFSRSFDMSGIDTDKIEASYEDGVLKLTLPKKEAVKPASKRLEVK